MAVLFLISVLRSAPSSTFDRGTIRSGPTLELYEVSATAPLPVFHFLEYNISHNPHLVRFLSCLKAAMHISPLSSNVI
ncbi:hypothetical protein BKA64DRAFT_305467 [Cadophora sp. MPI-SDFR-AT-0126]|nr:hypothetical protein BKA64DRAFT_305467 [Leotiomycetes sp. MPI-SDFR-AT-0126]